MTKKILVVLLFPCLVSAQSAFIAGNDTICSNDKEKAEVTVSFSGATPPFTFVYAINGVNQPSITTTINPSVINTAEAGTYTLQNFNDAILVGMVSGSAIVTVLESPTAIIHLASDTLSALSPQANFIGQSTDNIVSWSWYFGDNTPINYSSSAYHKFPLYRLGCMDIAANNYDASANTGDGSCCYDLGCTGFPTNPCLALELSSLGVSGIYQTALIVQDINECSDTATRIVSVHDDYWMYIPTSFTPDLDGTNDKFCIEYHAIRENTFLFKVYNAQGDLMYQSTKPNELRCSCDNGGWNGKHYKIEKDLPSDTYVYEIYFQDFEGWKHTEYGTIVLVR